MYYHRRRSEFQMTMTRLFVLGFLFAVFAGAVANAAEVDMLLRERCRKSECTFTKIINKRTVKKNATGTMVEVKSRSVVVPIPANTADPASMPVPENFGLVRVSYAHCSTEKPALIVYDDKKFRARLLNIGETPRKSLVDSHIEYWAVCHDRIVSVADVLGGALAKSASDLGYHEASETGRSLRKFRTKEKAFRFFGM